MNAPYSCTPFEHRHIAAAAALHQEAFPDFFLSSLGRPFLEEFYGAFLVEEGAAAKVVEHQGELMGVVVGTLHPVGFFKRLFLRRWFWFAFAASGALLKRPSIHRRLLRAIWYRGDGPKDGRSRALLSSIAVRPNCQNAGVGSILLVGWIQEVADQGATGAYLTTDAVGNESVNRFYQRCGWTRESHFTTPEGREMNRYVYNIA